MITAQQARKLTNHRQNVKIQMELRYVFERIRATADEGGCCVEFHQSQEVVTYRLIETYKKFLEEIGYKIIYYKAPPFSENVYSISW